MKKKSSYGMLFIAFFAFFFLLNFINLIELNLGIIIAIVITALIESLSVFNHNIDFTYNKS